MGYLDEVLRINASGGHAAPAENLDPDEITSDANEFGYEEFLDFDEMDSLLLSEMEEEEEEENSFPGWHFMPDGSIMRDDAKHDESGKPIGPVGKLVKEEADLAEALKTIADTYGKFNEDETGIWAGYSTPAENEVKDIGVKCGNCVLYQGGGVCSIISETVEEDGKCRFAVIPDGMVSLTATAGSKPAAPSERRKGSKKNKKGSASGGKKITFSKKVTESLQKKADDHNEKHGDTASKKTSVRTLKAVYRRGAGAFSTSHRPDQNRNSWAMARVNAFLYLLRNGRPKSAKYVQDNDLLPAAHKKSTK